MSSLSRLLPLLPLLAGCGEEERERSRPLPPPTVEERIEWPAPATPAKPPHALPAYREKWRSLAEANRPQAEGEFLTLGWPDLMPPDYCLESILSGYDVSGLSDTDYEAVKRLEEIKRVLERAPPVAELDGKRVRLPGYALPLEGDGEKTTEFLLLPYFGACIHVPPPPLNQTVYVVAKAPGVAVRRLFDTLWVSGRLTVQRSDSDWGNAGYTLYAEGIAYMDQRP